MIDLTSIDWKQIKLEFFPNNYKWQPNLRKYEKFMTQKAIQLIRKSNCFFMDIIILSSYNISSKMRARDPRSILNEIEVGQLVFYVQLEPNKNKLIRYNIRLDCVIIKRVHMDMCAVLCVLLWMCSKKTKKRF